jgi:hypothetical protein
MKLVTYLRATENGVERRTGAQLDGDVIDLATAAAARGSSTVPTDMLELLRGGQRTMEASREALEFAAEHGGDEHLERPIRLAGSEVQLCSPLPRPNSLRDFFLVKEHVEGGVERGFIPSIPDAWYEMPGCWKGTPDEVYGPDDVIPWPVYTDLMDYELEIAIVIGEAGRRISTADAPRHIAGYTIFNDWSARDIQKRAMSEGSFDDDHDADDDRTSHRRSADRRRQYAPRSGLGPGEGGAAGRGAAGRAERRRSRRSGGEGGVRVLG